MSNIQEFKFESFPFSVIERDGEPWFVAKEVCAILEHTNHVRAIQKLEEDEKGVTKVYSLGGEQDTLIISESGLYTLIIRSNKPNAKKFRKWVTSEVLPSIRKNGKYELGLASNELATAREEELLRKIINLQDEVISLYRKLDGNKKVKSVFISADEVLEIKELYNKGYSTRLISRRFGIPINKILEILKDEIY